MIDTSDEERQAFNLGDLLFKMYEPNSVIDVGCNTGRYLVPFALRGCEVLGIDYDREALSHACVPVFNVDISSPFKMARKYDLAICLEVLEHIPEEHAELVIHNLCSMSDKVIFSSAQVGQGGEGHINCKQKQYWHWLFDEEGFQFCEMETKFICDRMKGLEGTMGWLLNNLMVFRKHIHYPIVSKKPFISDVTAVITSCGRYDLLKQTLDSFDYKDRMRVIIRDDSEDKYQHDLILSHYGDKYEVIIYGSNRGQARLLDSLYTMVETPYIWHMEDDWRFIQEGSVEFSRQILKRHQEISTVQLDIRKEYFDAGAVGADCGQFYEYVPWKLTGSHLPWNGWCGSPHLLRKKDWEKIGQFSTCSTEKEYDSLYAHSGMKTVWAKEPYVNHIGYGRSVAKGHKTWL